jgi:glutamate-1-semialdehyde 2,1-aminomutase
LHGGTYNAQPVGMAATVATLEALSEPSTFPAIAQCGARLMDGIRKILHDAGIVAQVAGFPEVFHVGFGVTEPAQNYRDLLRLDRDRYVVFTTALLPRGIRALERGAWFMSAAHDDAVVDDTLRAVAAAAHEVGA